MCPCVNMRLSLSYLGQFFELVGIEQELLQAAGVAVDLIGHRVQTAVPLIHRLNVAVTPPERDALEHGGPPGLISASALETGLQKATPAVEIPGRKRFHKIQRK